MSHGEERRRESGSQHMKNKNKKTQKTEIYTVLRTALELASTRARARPLLKPIFPFFFFFFNNNQKQIIKKKLFKGKTFWKIKFLTQLWDFDKNRFYARKTERNMGSQKTATHSTNMIIKVHERLRWVCVWNLYNNQVEYFKTWERILESNSNYLMHSTTKKSNRAMSK